jgi:Autophagy receptor ATG43
MSHSALGIAETLQGASLKRHPSPAHDINPATAASDKELYEVAHSDTASIPSDIVDRPALRPVPRRPNLPPLPDLRFEQSYLASLKGAETWQRIAWITIRDQVL